MALNLAPVSDSAIPPAGLHVHALPPGAGFLPACARFVIEASGSCLPDLSSIVVVLPNQHIAPGFRRALAQSHGGALWMPKLFTLTGLAADALAAIDKDSDCARLMRLFGVLAKHPLFKSLGAWQLASELAQLFDELTERGEALPHTHEALAERLACGYEQPVGEALSLEAQFVHTLWQADREGLPSLAAALQQALREVVDGMPQDRPFFFMCDGALSATENRFIHTLAQKTRVHVFLPERMGEGDALLATLAAAWPKGDAGPPMARAAALCAAHPESALAGRLRFMAAASLEEEASNVALEVRARVVAGAKSIALIAADRVAARRARAALAAEGIEVVDETGWLLSTTRAAAFIDALLEMASSQGYHRAVLDLVKTPFACADWEEGARGDAIWMLERVIGKRNFVSGLSALARLVEREAPAAGELVARLQAVAAAFAGRAAGVAEWLNRLQQAIDACGARGALQTDAAGLEVCALIEDRARELAGFELRLSFAEWRDWLNREFERAMFRDDSIVSPVVITHLAAARLRAFDFAVVVGADREHLAPAASTAIFANEGVRRELGLATRGDARERLREDLTLLIAGCRELLFTRQAWKGDEHNLPSPELEVLDMVHVLAYGEHLRVEAAQDAVRGGAAGLAPRSMPAPAVPAEHVPSRVSASGYASLVACPYQYFARHVLRLAEQDEVSEALEKRDYGDVVHGLLNRFHAQYPRLSDVDDATLIATLEAMTVEAFKAVVEDNFLEHAWRTRWQMRIPAYLEWARSRESEGWWWRDGEQAFERVITLHDGAPLTLHGRIDRIDQAANGVALLDYKTQGIEVLKQKVKDLDADVQLPFYSLLYPGSVAHAAYVALDDERVAEAGVAEVARVGEMHHARLREVFSDLRQGASMPAHGAEHACGYCEMMGLCRKPHHTS